jgi:RNA polymerase sigma-70 factor (ECF subfamily)
VESPRDERTLVEAARGGDREALEQLLERQQARVLRFGIHMCRDEEDAKDIVQETLLAAARSFGDFRGASSLPTWLYAIARSFCAKKRRRSKFAPAHEGSLEGELAEAAARVPDRARGPESAAMGREVRAALEEAIGELDPGQREVMVLRDVEGLSTNEVAEVVGISPEAVKTRLHRARAAVRARLAILLGEAPPRGPAGCPDVVTLFSKHLEGEIGAEDCAAMELHLQSCDGCREACESLRRTLALCREAPHPRVPGDLQGAVRRKLRHFLQA